MLPIAYSVSETLKEHVGAVDTLRRLVLAAPVSPMNELKLRFQAMVNRIYGSLTLGGISISKHDILTTLTSPPKRPKPQEQQVLAYKQALEWIRSDWTANPKPITPAVVTALATMVLARPASSVERAFSPIEQEVRRVLDYLESRVDHPIIISAVAHAQLLAMPVGQDDVGRIARLTSSLFLAKFGYDLRGMLAPEKSWQEAPESYKRAHTTIAQTGQMTAWLEYCAKTQRVAIEELKRDIGHISQGVRTEVPASFWELNERQKAVLALLENPTATITNREVQKRFRVSQITASRDLTKLVSLGLLLPRGKGRAVKYLKGG